VQARNQLVQISALA